MKQMNGASLVEKVTGQTSCERGKESFRMYTSFWIFDRFFQACYYARRMLDLPRNVGM
jgi:hypothetical protein